MLTTLELLALAADALTRSNAPMRSSAKLCLDDAKHCYGIGQDANARLRAIDSLRYSVGVFSAEYE